MCPKPCSIYLKGTIYFEGIGSRGLGVEGFGFRDYRTQNGNCSLGFWVEGIGFRV